MKKGTLAKAKFMTGALFLVIFILFGIAYYQTAQPNRFSPDALKIGNISQLQQSLEYYARDNEGLYPPSILSCEKISQLESYIVPTYVERLPPVELASDIRVSINQERTKYAMQTTLQNDHIALQNDIDGHVLGCNCDDPAYCVLSNTDPNR